jgi:hypothetical protein
MQITDSHICINGDLMEILCLLTFFFRVFLPELVRRERQLAWMRRKNAVVYT